MEAKPTIVVSDIHLGAVPAETERGFRAFLDHVATHAAALLINGDLFDFWFEYRHVILREHFRVVAKLADVVEAGVPVTFVGGNHDAWGGSFLQDLVGMRMVDGPLEMDLAGRRALVAHGDGVGRGDLKYRALKAVIRSRAAIGAFRVLHPDMGRGVALLASRTERKAGTLDEATRGRAAYIQAWGEQVLRERPELDLVVTGHAHLAGLVEVEAGRFYVNSGDWIGRAWSYLEIPAEPGPPVLRDWRDLS